MSGDGTSSRVSSSVTPSSLLSAPGVDEGVDGSLLDEVVPKEPAKPLPPVPRKRRPGGLPCALPWSSHELADYAPSHLSLDAYRELLRKEYQENAILRRKREALKTEARRRKRAGVREGTEDYSLRYHKVLGKFHVAHVEASPHRVMHDKEFVAGQRTQGSSAPCDFISTSRTSRPQRLSTTCPRPPRRRGSVVVVGAPGRHYAEQADSWVQHRLRLASTPRIAAPHSGKPWFTAADGAGGDPFSGFTRMQSAQDGLRHKDKKEAEMLRHPLRFSQQHTPLILPRNTTDLTTSEFLALESQFLYYTGGHHTLHVSSIPQMPACEPAIVIGGQQLNYAAAEAKAKANDGYLSIFDVISILFPRVPQSRLQEFLRGCSVVNREGIPAEFRLRRPDYDELLEIYNLFDREKKGYLTRGDLRTNVHGAILDHQEAILTPRRREGKDGRLTLDAFAEILKYSYMPYT